MNKKGFKKALIATVKLIVVTIVIGGGVVAYSISSVNSKGGSKIVKMEELPKDADAIIVLGAGIDDKGVPSDILIDRLDTSLDVYNSKACSKFLLSGDHGKIGYNEVGAMKDYIMDNCELNDKNIFLDHAGFSTYETIYRAKEIFGVNKAIIVTNEYHLPRTLYIAEKLGIDAYGISSDKRNYLNIKSYKKREDLAKVKDFMYTNIIKPEPTFLGDSIPINSSDGRLTDDEV
ncbi:SanA/YdcF family protein [Clostridium sp.]|uniref:SanA/YdcF family protein n=1 Tax=Clostridium sp. TaxID=1506 RepID=UPI002FCA4D12